MRLEFINKVVEGDILGKNILTDDGRILLRSGVKLTDAYISKLKQLGVLYVYVEDERLDDIQGEDEKLSELKQVTMRSMSKVVKNVSSGNGKKARKSLSVVEDLIDYIIELGDVNISLYDIKTYDNYTYLHCLDTGIMSTFLGLSSNYSDGKLKELGIAGILHDIGKIKVPKEIINKKGPLTSEEFEEIKKHPIYGMDILKENIFFTEHILKAVVQHHEKIDGSGYPYGLTGNEICDSGKIVCICDVYDAVSNDRSYRRKFRPNDAYELILAGSGTMFDKDNVELFKETFAVYPLGCCLKLSNGIEGYVVKQNKGFPDRPVIRILYDSVTKKPIPFYEIDLLYNNDIGVEGIV